LTIDAPHLADLPLTGRRILVAEDDFIVANDLSQLLQAAGASVVGPVARLKDALGACQAELHAAVMDVNLGGAWSLPAIEKLTRDGVFVVLHTSYSPDELPERFRRLPIAIKPGAEYVLSALGRALRRD
jgi:CheY-like chemotaxis protein